MSEVIINSFYCHLRAKTKYINWIIPFCVCVCVVFAVHYVLVHRELKLLESYGDSAFATAMDIGNEVDHSIRIANSVKDDFCSSSDIRFLTEVMFAYEYIVDVGRVDNGHVACTVKLGSLTPPVELGTYTIKHKEKLIQRDNGLSAKEASNIRVFSKGSVIVSVNDMFFHNVDLSSLSLHGMGGILYNKQTKQVVQKFGEVSEIDVSSLLGKQNFNWLPLPNNFLEHRECNDDYNICLVVFQIKPGIYQLDLFLIVFLGLIGFSIGKLFLWKYKDYYYGQQAFTRALSHAINNNQIYPVYQPKVHLSNGKMAGVEALARWHDPQLGQISPEIFIAAAEQSLLISKLTRKFIVKVFDELNTPEFVNAGYTVSINIAISTLLEEDFFDFIESQRIKTQLPTENIILEITERSSADFKQMSAYAKRFSRAGYKISLDDFGTGMSNLTWINTFEPNEIKIDKEFTQAIDCDTLNKLTLEGIFGLLEKFNVHVVFEGIETQVQLNYILQRSPQAIGQGWLFAKPLEPSALFDYIERDG
ncbi:EAL domain-containing protein [Agarivorans sp. Z349TD_8]|uniref:EAL domain-containing protein n=1 Tax=Agarivorans sp. Z349TD_8 TaxID=3421434 RepID=UPI003D7D1346